MSEPNLPWNLWFPFLNDFQLAQWEAAKAAYLEWNQRINVISRKDIQHIDVHHAAHSFALARCTSFSPNSRCFDIGTGGGFPGIPLAIAFPQTQFVLVDSIGKKLRVAEAAAQAAQLNNVETIHSRVELLKEKTDYLTGRAVAPLFDFYQNVKHLLRKNSQAEDAGIWYFKGPEPEPLFAGFQQLPKTHHLELILPDPWFQGKTLWHIPIR